MAIGLFLRHSLVIRSLQDSSWGANCLDPKITSASLVTSLDPLEWFGFLGSLKPCQEFQKFQTTNRNQQWLIAGCTRLFPIAMENHDNYISKSCEIIYLYPFLWAMASLRHWRPISRLCNSFLSAGLSTGTSTRSAHWRISKITHRIFGAGNPQKMELGCLFPRIQLDHLAPRIFQQLPLGTIHRLGPEVLGDRCKTIV